MSYSHMNKLTGIRKVLAGVFAALLLIGLAFAIATAPAHDSAYAAETQLQAGQSPQLTQTASSEASEDDDSAESEPDGSNVAGLQLGQYLDAAMNALDTGVNKVLTYDAADIAAIGNQNESGHTICCPSYACAYADAVLDGTVHDHDYYTCSCCTWTDWGGGDSAYRCVGTDEEVLREAYDQIAAGKPVVTHVTWAYGEHWIALIGYRDVVDPDHLTLGNFIALNPSDGAQIVASDGYELYGDGCQHISER